MSEEAKKPEPAWIGNRMGRIAEALKGKSKGTFGAANAVKRLMAWSCACGWEGTSRELKAGPDGLACPLCGGGGLKPK